MKRVLLTIWLLLAFAMFVLGLAGCTTQRRAVKYFNNHGFEAASYCAASFPVTDSVAHSTTVRYDTIVTPGGTVIIKDTTVCPASDTVVRVITEKWVDCPPVRIITTSIHDTATVYRENKAKYQAEHDQRVKYQADAERLKNGRNTWRKIAIILIVLIGVYIAGRVSKYIP